MTEQGLGASAKADRATREPSPSSTGLGHTASVPSAAFTPGPWQARKKLVHVEGKGTVALVHNPWNNEGEREANARLIAAAPELYEALIEIREFSALSNASASRIDALLAKARGEQVSA
jgi:hypothetical protein